MPIDGDKERRGIADLLLQKTNEPVVLALAKGITKNVIEIGTSEEALEILFKHMPDTHTLLNKRSITKEILFKYVHSNQIPVSIDFTKAILISKIIQFWESGEHIKKKEEPSQSPKTVQNNESNKQEIQETEYPINLLARTFSEWFFKNYNAGTLKIEDFWKDSQMFLRIAATDRIDEQRSISAEQVVETLMGCKQQFNLFFNPNLSHEGVQGRMDVHGLVIVLVCGTLHTVENCVGVFETSFGLMRDPFALNNWKIKTIQSVLRSQGSPKEPVLSESDTLKDTLALPAPTGEIS